MHAQWMCMSSPGRCAIAAGCTSVRHKASYMCMFIGMHVKVHCTVFTARYAQSVLRKVKVAVCCRFLPQDAPLTARCRCIRPLMAKDAQCWMC